MYLKVQYNNSIKQYSLTNNYNKPYIKVNGSILPLTTNTTNGIHINIQANNTTYRPLEYQSMSTSNTYYTSAVNSNGLSSTTALTRSSTSQTIYHTCSSTSGTSYLTRSSTSGTSYLTQSTTDIVFTSIYSAFGYTGSYQYHSEATTYDIKTVRLMTNYGANSTLRFGTYTWGNVYLQMTYQLYGNRVTVGSSTYNYTSNGSVSSITRNVSLYTTSMGAVYQIWLGAASSTDYINMTFSSTSNQYDQPDYYHYTNRSMSTYFTQRYAIDITGTSYLTRSSTSATSYLTRSSTSRTEYKTRASTSGYSGISSSSSQSSGWL